MLGNRKGLAKVFLTVLLGLAFVLLPFQVTDAAKAELPSGWAEKDVAWMVNEGLVPEKLQSKYASFITREEFASLVYGVLNYFAKEVRGKDYNLVIPRHTKFEDAEGAIIDTAYAVGIINGITVTEFSPSSHISREQGAVMMANMMNTLSVSGLSAEDVDFADKLSISRWAFDSVNICGNAKIFVGTPNGFRPSDQYTREQAIVTIKRMFDFIDNDITSIKIRNQIEIPIATLEGGLSVGDRNVRFYKLPHGGDKVFHDYMDAITPFLNKGTFIQAHGEGFELEIRW